MDKATASGGRSHPHPTPGGRRVKDEMANPAQPDAKLIELARSTAVKYGLPPDLICAICEQESGWNPWAIRYEPVFYAHYIAPNEPETTESRAQAFSWGLMQVMGLTARELKFKGHLASMCDPATGLDVGCRVFATKMKQARNDVAKALLLYNGGADKNYPDEVLARVNAYAQNAKKESA